LAVSTVTHTDLQYLVKTIRVLYARGGYDSAGFNRLCASRAKVQLIKGKRVLAWE